MSGEMPPGEHAEYCKRFGRESRFQFLSTTKFRSDGWGVIMPDAYQEVSDAIDRATITALSIKAERDRLREVNAELLKVAKHFVRCIEYRIRCYFNDGDGEGARMATITLNMTLEAIAKAEAAS